MGFTVGSRGEVPGKKETLGQEMRMMMMMMIIIIIIIYVLYGTIMFLHTYFTLDTHIL
jgi:hypothetical protein